MHTLSFILLLSILFGAAFAQTRCVAPSITQTRLNTWETDGKQHSEWEAVIKTENYHIVSLNIGFHLPEGAQMIDLWELTETSYQSLGIADTFGFPEWRNPNPLVPGDVGGLKANRSHTFGYILSSSLESADVVLTSVKCAGLLDIVPEAILCNSTFHTECFTFQATKGTGENNCYNFGDFFTDKLSSFLYFGNDEAFRLEVFDNFDCSGSNLYSATPGPHKLENTAMDNTASSMRFVGRKPAEGIFCNQPSLEECNVYKATEGLDACYNFDSNSDKQVSSFQLFSNDYAANGITFYEGSECSGENWVQGFGEATNGYYSYVTDEYNERASSFKFNPVA